MLEWQLQLLIVSLKIKKLLTDYLKNQILLRRFYLKTRKNDCVVIKSNDFNKRVFQFEIEWLSIKNEIFHKYS